MKPRPLTAGLLVVAVATLAVALGLGRQAVPARSDAPAASSRPPEAEVRTRAPIDVRSLRNVFRFADEPDPSPFTEPDPVDAARPAAEPKPVLRLVGLLWSGGRLRAALTIDGEVVLAGAGEAVLGVTVLSVDADAVRIRRSDGTEDTLTPP